MVLRGIRQLPQATRQPWCPVTPEIMSLLFRSWSQAPSGANFDAVMLWAACCTAFFGFLHAGEFTCSSLQAFRSTMFSMFDVSVDSYERPSVVTVRLRQSKADSFWYWCWYTPGQNWSGNLSGFSPTELHCSSRAAARSPLYVPGWPDSIRSP